MATGEVQYTTRIGDSVGFDGSSGPEKVFDGDVTTVFAAANASGGWIGVDIGTAAQITRFRFAPRIGDSGSDFQEWMIGGKVQVSSTADFSSDVTDVDTIPTWLPFYPCRSLSERSITASSKRYARYIGPANTYSTTAELRFIGQASGVTAARPVAPVVSPWGGRFPSGTATITATSLTTSAVLYYSDDGVDPTYASTEYTGSFPKTFSGDTTLKFVAYDPSLDNPYSEITTCVFTDAAFEPAKDWKDDKGDLLQFHAGSLYGPVDGRFYYIGFNARGRQVDADLSNYYCLYIYSSSDLYNWRYESQVGLNGYKFANRMSVKYCADSGKYVLWASLYNTLATRFMSIATSNGPTGPFTYVGTSSLNGRTFGDFSLFVDTDATAYICFTDATGSNNYVSNLTSDYTDVAGDERLVFNSGSPREASQMIKVGGTYFYVTSASNYYDSTLTFDSRYVYNTGATPLADSWTNPTGDPGGAMLFDSDPVGTDYNGQPAMLYPVPGKIDGSVIAIFDHWSNTDLSASRQVWLPASFPTATSMHVSTPDVWNLSDFDDVPTATGKVQFVGTAISSGDFDGFPKSAAFDGDFNTNWAASTADNGWIGLDLGTAATVTRFMFSPQRGSENEDFELRAVGAMIQSSSTSDFSSDVTTHDTIGLVPFPSSYVFNVRNFTGRSARYWRFLGAAGKYGGGLAELRIVGDAGTIATSRPVRPTISPWGGGYPSGSVTVTIASETTSAAIYYTTDGTAPDTSSTLYTGPFSLTISGNVTVRAIAYDASLSTPSSEECNPGRFRDYAYKPNTDQYAINTGDLLELHNPSTPVEYPAGSGTYWVASNSANLYGVQWTDGIGKYGIWILSTTDFVNYTDHGNVLGMPDDWGFIVRPQMMVSATTGRLVLGGHAYIEPTNPLHQVYRWSTDGDPATTADWTDEGALDPNGVGYKDGSWGRFNGVPYMIHTNGAQNGVVISEMTDDLLGTTGDMLVVPETASTSSESPWILDMGTGVLGVGWCNPSTYYDSASFYGHKVCTCTDPFDSGTYAAAVDLFPSSPLGTDYNGQPSSIFIVPNKINGFVLKADFWNATEEYLSRAVEIPLDVTSGVPQAMTPTMWDLSLFSDAGMSCSPSMTSQTSTTATLSAGASGGTTPYTYAWTTTSTPYGGSASYDSSTSAAPTVTYTKAGDYVHHVVVTDTDDNTAEGDVTVTVSQTLTTITVGSANVLVSTTHTFTASAVDQFDNAMTITPTWSVTSGTGSIDGSTGVFTAPSSAETDTIRATSGSVHGDGTANVVASFVGAKSPGVAKKLLLILQRK